MATLNPAEYYRVDHEIGSLAPGRSADLVVLNDVEQVDIATVVAQGTVVAPTPEPPRDDSMPDFVRGRIRLPRKLTGEDFRLEAPGDSARVRVMEVTDGNLLSGTGEAACPSGTDPWIPTRGRM